VLNTASTQAAFAPLHLFRQFDWTRARDRAMDVVVADDRIRVAIDEAANALQAAVLLTAQIEADQRELRRAIERAARALAQVQPGAP